MPDFAGDFAVGTVVGLRAWRYRAEHWGGTPPPPDTPLMSVFRKYCWHAGSNAAKCLLAPGQTPNSLSTLQGMPPSARGPRPHDLEASGGLVIEHTCGFYAYTNVDSLGSQGNGPIAGIIAGWGRTVIGTKGFRTSTAKILALCVNPHYRQRDDAVVVEVHEAAEKAAAVYGCTLYSGLDEMLADYALGDSTGLSMGL